MNSNSNLPLVSVIVRTCKGRLNRLKEAVPSVLNQTYSNIEIVIVEDGSNDAEVYAKDIPAMHGVSVVYRSTPKVGRCRAGNIGLGLSNGKFLCFLDDDDIYFENHFEILVHELMTHPDVSGVYALAFEVPTKIISEDRWEYKEFKRKIVYKQNFSRVLLWHHNYIPIQALVFRRELYDNFGGFDESLEMLEDWNLWTRYTLSYNFMLVEKVTSLYRVPAEGKKILERLFKLSDYHSKVLEKQKDLKAVLSPFEVQQYAKEMSDYLNFAVIPKPIPESRYRWPFIIFSLYRYIIRLKMKLLRSLK
ncbi:MAG: glycosyltransferase [Nitrospirae bacterium]|nr:glycosyltransferase [Nitrospirota bacterium]